MSYTLNVTPHYSKVLQASLVGASNAQRVPLIHNPLNENTTDADDQASRLHIYQSYLELGDTWFKFPSHMKHDELDAAFQWVKYGNEDPVIRTLLAAAKSENPSIKATIESLVVMMKMDQGDQNV